MTEQQAIDRARLGTFRIDFDTIDREPDLARAILKDVVILRAESFFETKSIHYTGFHPAFPINQRGTIAHHVEPLITSETLDDGTTHHIVNWRE